MIHQFYVHGELGDSGDLEKSKISIFNDENPEIAYMEQQAYEYIYNSGIDTLIYLRTNDLGKVDKTWEEENQPNYDRPIIVRGQFKPDPMQVSLKKWGVDIDLKININYSRADLISRFGNRLIRSGDIIEIPYNSLIQTQNTEYVDGLVGQATKFRVVTAYESGNYNYVWLYWVCSATILSGDRSNLPE